VKEIRETTKVEKMNFSFKKEEKLCSKKIIDQLFADGDSFLVFPLKFVYQKTLLSEKSPVQSAFTVGKKNFKKAVQRNRIKRLMRESYRLNKHMLYSILDKEQLAIFVIFIGKEIPDYTLVEKAMKKGITKLIDKISSEIS